MAPVAPLAGAWIETLFASAAASSCAVAPLAGAWIETILGIRKSPIVMVAPLAGAWIETIKDPPPPNYNKGRSPCGSVD